MLLYSPHLHFLPHLTFLEYPYSGKGGLRVTMPKHIYLSHIARILCLHDALKGIHRISRWSLQVLRECSNLLLCRVPRRPTNGEL